MDREIEAQTIAMQIKNRRVYLNCFFINFGKLNATRTDEEINSAMEKVIKDLETKLGAQLRT